MKELKLNVKNGLIKSFLYIAIIIIFCVLMMILLKHFGIISKKYYTAKDFDIKTIHSKVDYDYDNIDDYTDIILGARNSEKNKPSYVSKYYDDAYPPDNEGVCTDVVWRAFKNAGYSLKDMVDKDIKNHIEDYPDIREPDPNIDFRRVSNLKVFFNKYAINLTLDYNDIEEWQPGDIVIFEGQKHIGIISDRRNEDGIPYVIHNRGQYSREEEYLTKSTISGHYRFDASLIDKEILVAWK